MIVEVEGGDGSEVYVCVVHTFTECPEVELGIWKLGHLELPQLPRH